MSENPYQAPEVQEASATSVVDRKPRSIGMAILVALGQQVVLLGMSSLVLDGGVLFRTFAGVFAVSWVISLCVMLVRRDRTGWWELAIIEYGFWPLLLCYLAYNRPLI